MEIGLVSNPQSVTVNKGNNKPAKNRENNSGSINSISIAYEHTEVTAEYTVYNGKGKIDRPAGGEVNTPKEITVGEVVQLREAIHAEVLAQVKDFLGTFFEEDAEAVEQVSRGEIPEYFNVENTARRILDIYFAYFEEGQDRVAFVERAKGIIEQAYGDVEGMVGELPDVVLETRAKVMEILETFASGGDISEFMQQKID